MALNRDSRLAAKVRWMRVLGFCVYVAAFFLPAVHDRMPAGAEFSAANVYKGWFCAAVTLTNSFSRDVWLSKDFLSVLSGWINPLIVIYLFLLVRDNFVWPRRIVAMAVVAFMFATWIYFALASMVPMIGHVLWILGALMILAGEVVRTKTSRTEADVVRTLSI